MFTKRFLSTFTNSTKTYYMPYINVSFYDNPYLLKDKQHFDLYNIKLPVHIYSKDKNGHVKIYSMLNNWVDYNNHKEEVYLQPYEFLDKIQHLIINYTINNQNISLIKNSLSFQVDKFSTIKRNIFPVYIFPKQQKHPQYRVNRSMYDIKTLLIPSRDEKCISQVWRQVGEFYDFEK